jgi:hypothetical protein
MAGLPPPRWLAPCRAALCWVILTGALAACSTLRIGYDNADTLLVYTFDNYLDLDTTQAEFLRHRIRAVLAWHRATQLPEYAGQLAAMQARIAAGRISDAEVLGYIDALDARLAAIGAQGAPDLAQLGATLQPAQIEQLRDKLAQDADKARRRIERYGRRGGLDERVAQYVDRAEPWFGALSKEQRARIRSALAARPGAPQLWADEVEQRGRDLLLLLERIRTDKPDPASAAAWMRQYVVELSEPADPRRRARLEENRRDNAALIAQLINSASPKQTAALLRHLAKYADDFSALAAERARAGAG